ncbi:MAG: hypothetical protein J7K34_01745 [Flavobacteriaceae bacterium]|nr:hypothetical protein [Flavobacteriaceae bacterium]
MKKPFNRTFVLYRIKPNIVPKKVDNTAMVNAMIPLFANSRKVSFPNVSKSVRNEPSTNRATTNVYTTGTTTKKMNKK